MVAGLHRGGKALTSKRLSPVRPNFPSRSARQVSVVPTPSGVTSPMPEITPRLSVGFLHAPQGNIGGGGGEPFLGGKGAQNFVHREVVRGGWLVAWPRNGLGFFHPYAFRCSLRLRFHNGLRFIDEASIRRRSLPDRDLLVTA